MATTEERLAALEAHIKKLERTVAELEERLKITPKLSEPTELTQLAATLASTLERLPVSQPPEGGTVASLKSIDIDLKALVSVRDEKAFVEVPQRDDTIDPGRLSTLRLSFVGVPAAAIATRTPPKVR